MRITLWEDLSSFVDLESRNGRVNRMGSLSAGDKCPPGVGVSPLHSSPLGTFIESFPTPRKRGYDSHVTGKQMEAPRC